MHETNIDGDELESLQRRHTALREGLREALESERTARAATDDALALCRAYGCVLFNVLGAESATAVHNSALAWLANAVPWPCEYIDADGAGLDADSSEWPE